MSPDHRLDRSLRPEYGHNSGSVNRSNRNTRGSGFPEPRTLRLSAGAQALHPAMPPIGRLQFCVRGLIRGQTGCGHLTY
jgi:hypothetical protein